tara:strand:+ start:4101 stop:4391 length:291 start_codon:yes stop_codon:yes gene_type:complete
MVKLLSIKPSKIKGKKYTAVFQVGDKTKTTHFGASGYTDFIKSGGDLKKKKAYIARHKKENWTTPMTAGTLSRYILWNLPTLKASIADYKKRFKVD